MTAGFVNASIAHCIMICRSDCPRRPSPSNSLTFRPVLARIMLGVFSPRIASLFVFSMSASALRTGAMPRWLAALSYLAALTHPALDWLNTYGMRWWMPLSDRWSYGDAVFIMDPWLWLALGGCWLLARRPSPGLAIGFAVLAALLVWVVSARAPGYLALVAAVAALLVAAMLVREEMNSGEEAGS